ncbi:nicotinamide mononucleotide transporter [Sediminihabitans luteus]|uniref:Nicotinamide mononucleotide transporter n=1 Tax=Sediminihabitans luteus TaxID=1138585 RepID=A0A2M9CQ55_9CELL|nr:nicotinamide riboside transporter PnuC [Sediminihabitans luteus]PJJ73961.1 nicotinamide mononucleotide transporter [Sediminihabitans luteus]GII98126.1 putative nicotinamide mononucleotide transporter [Sediminihabitans luteus]
MTIEEIIGFVTGALCVWLAVRQNVWTFPLGIANNLVYVVLFFDRGIYANAGLQVVYLALGALGWFWWVRGGPDGGALTVSRTPRWGWPVALVSFALLAVALWAVLTTWTDSAVPVADAATTASSLVAQMMLNRKWLGSWWVWIATDVALVALFASQGLWLTAVLYVGFIGLCVHGLVTWRRELAPSVGRGKPALAGAS